MEYDLFSFPFAKADKGKLLAPRPMMPVAESVRKFLLFMVFLYVLLQRYNFSDKDEAKSGGNAYLDRQFFCYGSQAEVAEEKTTWTSVHKYTYL